MSRNAKTKILIISDFNADNFSEYLKNDEESPAVISNTSLFGQTMQTLADFSMPCWLDSPEFLIVWTQLHQISSSFNHFLIYEKSSIDSCFNEIDAFCNKLAEAAQRVTALFVPTWTVPAHNRGLGVIDLKNDHGIGNILMRANLRLIDNLKSTTNIYILNAQRWMELAGARNANNPKLWYMGKIAFGNEVFREAGRDIKSAIRAIRGQARKLIILDLDNTIWGGIIGETGKENLRLGGHDPVGESFVDFQKALKALKTRGILLAIVSKNDENIAIDAISSHPEMILQLNDFVGWRINWKDKAENILELASELNIGLQSIVFIDDSPNERSRVREAISEVEVPDWPEDSLLYTKTLLSMRCFDSFAITEEDMQRTKLYTAEKERTAAHTAGQSLDEWLHSLETHVIAEQLTSINLSRTVQLLNKTNQMNLSTRRMTETELSIWAEQKNHHLWTFRVTDKFGDAGLTGIASLEIEKGTVSIIDFILSCRILGRKIEQAMLHFIINKAKQLGGEKIEATYIPTPKNQVCLSFWKESSGFVENADSGIFTYNNLASYPLPASIVLVEN
ncbi:MAG: HAD-IIIC family phosphatase [Erysipelotrichia bacterium]|nr:HAD-IIIC family phosphatase [Erysipelotrichia bacterium]